MDSMKEGGENIKDSQKKTLQVKDTPVPISYPKTTKLISALYMVTDIMDKEESIRNSLRTLGAEILSDVHYINIQKDAAKKLFSKVGEMLSFLEVASLVNMISIMNFSILRAEFLELQKSIREFRSKNEPMGSNVSIEEFLNSVQASDTLESIEEQAKYSKGHDSAVSFRNESKGSLGVQKASNLLDALSYGVKKSPIEKQSKQNDFGLLKKERRFEIVKALKSEGGWMTISEIKDKGLGVLKECGYKTLQREVVSMVDDGVLKKQGEKRWSKYSLA